MKENMVMIRNIQRERVCLPEGLTDPGIEAYKRVRGYEALPMVLLSCPPQEVVEIIKESGLRGRGGAGFPTGLKWENAREQKSHTRFLVANGAEGEPGTQKDRYLMENNPHQLIEGIILASYAIGAKEAFIFIAHHFEKAKKAILRALDEAHQHRYWGEESYSHVEIKIFESTGAYLSGEETALIQEMMGKDVMPRSKPGCRPTLYGLWGYPTAVNNIETLVNVPPILLHGAKWFRTLGTETAPGTMLFTLSGDVKKPGVYELPMGTPLGELIYTYGEGLIDERRLKIVFPGGPSNAPLTPRHLDIPMDFNSLREAGSGLGSGAVMVFDETRCVVDIALAFLRFFANESCGQCGTCIHGTMEAVKLLHKIERKEGTDQDIARLSSLAQTMYRSGVCGLVDGASSVLSGILRYFGEECEDHLFFKTCPYRATPMAQRRGRE